MAESFIEDPETDEAKRPSPLTSLVVNLRTKTQVRIFLPQREYNVVKSQLTDNSKM